MKTTLHYKFDAFISYSHKDEIWVRNVLLSVLEKNGVKVIIDFRDFKPGAPSVTEMERAIIESWKTILVLSPNYINSSWSEYESIMIATLDPAGSDLPPLIVPITELVQRVQPVQAAPQAQLEPGDDILVHCAV